MFQLKRKNVDMIKSKYKRQRAVSHEDLRSTQGVSTQSTPPNKLPFLVELNPGTFTLINLFVALQVLNLHSKLYLKFYLFTSYKPSYHI